MIRHKWITGVRNKIASFYMECDSCAAIDGACLTPTEREELKSKLRNAVHYIDNKLK